MLFSQVSEQRATSTSLIFMSWTKLFNLGPSERQLGAEKEGRVEAASSLLSLLVALLTGRLSSATGRGGRWPLMVGICWPKSALGVEGPIQPSGRWWYSPVPGSTGPLVTGRPGWNSPAPLTLLTVTVTLSLFSQLVSLSLLSLSRSFSLLFLSGTSSSSSRNPGICSGRGW